MILRKETETIKPTTDISIDFASIRMNDTPQGDGNILYLILYMYFLILLIRMNDTPQGDGNSFFIVGPFQFQYIFL